ncbi:radical SAM family heme chaperone HemW [Algirhabdus cladophorae]|uniref:radical SAM family heme chaperone HemW n=1 Tax=Algirhabdus cladophorae TaxID=3377108 RepID=UPI003B84A88C
MHSEEAGFGLYVHWPYCEAKCPYCDFNSFVEKSIDHDAWTQAYLLELERAYRVSPNEPLTSIFFGGGTPSLMRPKTVEAVLAKANSLWGFSNDVEITLEANPSSVEAQKFTDFRLAGINRVSLGVQSLVDADLKRLGRLHTVDEALTALDIANAEFDRVSFDLIYGRQDQTLGAWSHELDRALELTSGHISLYQLTIEPNTAFGDRYAIGKLSGLPNEDLGADMYELVQDRCGARDLMAYEVSNHAKKGHESRHNLTYWRYGDYVGIGPGAHGRLTISQQKVATETILAPQLWLKAALDADTLTHSTTCLTNFEADQERALMGLRLKDGIDTKDFRSDQETVLNAQKLNELQVLGLIDKQGSRICATQEGRPVLNYILRSILDTDAT